jgi:hypothetical protein
MTPASEPMIEITSVVPVVAIWPNAKAILAIWNWQSLSIILVLKQLLYGHAFFKSFDILGFMNKVKKVLECVCFYCGKLKLDEVLLSLLNRCTRLFLVE